jgi:hypothetical protein
LSERWNCWEHAQPVDRQPACLLNCSGFAALSYKAMHLFRYTTLCSGGMLVVCNEEVVMKNDKQIQGEVIAELKQDGALAADSIGVEVHHGVVKLAGRNGDTEMKQRVVQGVRRVQGVTGIILNMGTGIEQR